MDVVCIENTDTEEECYECGKTLPDVPFLARVRFTTSNKDVCYRNQSTCISIR